jgi:hypothetical protein
MRTPASGPTDKDVVMPQVTIKIAFDAPNHDPEVLSEYLCDWPGCANVAVHVLGCVKEIGAVAAVCDEHAAALEARKPRPDAP